MQATEVTVKVMGMFMITLMAPVLSGYRDNFNLMRNNSARVPSSNSITVGLLTNVFEILDGA